tara:strand:+ start:1776 stop:2045 length:270 start_codon:yes stop_codon:yes gene_type:complete
MQQLLYFHVSATLIQEGVAKATAVFFPIKSTGYLFGEGGVTLEELVEIGLQKRLKGATFPEILVSQTKKEVLETVFQTSADSFTLYTDD